MSGVEIDPNLFNSLMASPKYAQSQSRATVLQSNYYHHESLPNLNGPSRTHDAPASNDRRFSSSSQDPATKVHPRSHYSPSIGSKFFNSSVVPSEPLPYIDTLSRPASAHQKPVVTSVSTLDRPVDVSAFTLTQITSTPGKIPTPRSQPSTQHSLRSAVPTTTPTGNPGVTMPSFALTGAPLAMLPSAVLLDTLLLDVTDYFNYSSFQESVLTAPPSYSTWRLTSSIRLGSLNSITPFNRVLSIWNDPPVPYEEPLLVPYYPSNDTAFSPFRAPTGASISEDPLDMMSLSLQVLLLQVQQVQSIQLATNDLQQHMGAPHVLQSHLPGPYAALRSMSASFADSLNSSPIRPQNIYLKKVSNTQSFIPTLYQTGNGISTTILVQPTPQLLAKSAAEVIQHLKVSQHTHESISSIPKEIHDYIHNCSDDQTMDSNNSTNSVILENSNLENSNLSMTLVNSTLTTNLEFSSLTVNLTATVPTVTLASGIPSRLTSHLCLSKIVISLPKRISNCEVQHEFNHYILSEENMKKPYHEDYCLTFYKRNSHGYMFVKEPTTSLKVNSNGVGSKLWVQLKVNLPRFEASSRKLKIDVRELSHWWPATSNSSKPKRLRKRDQPGDGQRRKKPLSRHKS